MLTDIGIIDFCPSKSQRVCQHNSEIEKILRHCGLRQPSRPRAPPAGIGWVHSPDDEPPELTYVDINTFEATF